MGSKQLPCTKGPLRVLECSDLGSFLGQTPGPVISWGSEASRPPHPYQGCFSLNVKYLPQIQVFGHSVPSW